MYESACWTAKTEFLTLNHKENTVNIYVGNFSFDVNDEDLLQVFTAFGEVKSASIIKDRSSVRSKGFGFVEMPLKTEAQAAIDGMNGKEMNGRVLTVNEARPRPEGDHSRIKSGSMRFS